jgi:hypothetical protein
MDHQMEEEIQKIKTTVHLEDDEKVEYYWRGAALFTPQTRPRGDFMIFDANGTRTKTNLEGVPTAWREPETGDFLLTSNKIVWLTPIGLLKKNLASQFVLRFSEIQGVTIAEGFNKKLVIKTENGIFGFCVKNVEFARKLIQGKIEPVKNDSIQIIQATRADVGET